MRALQIAELVGPDALSVVDLPEPAASHFLTPDQGVLIDVRAAAVSFPDVLQSRGLYQFKPDLPFVPGAEVAGVVAEASPESGVEAGDRVAAMTMLGGMAERVAAPAPLTFKLPDQLDFAEGAALILNYHTAYFALKLRGRLREGEKVLVHGAAGGVGTACLQVAKALGAGTVAVVSTEEKERVAREAGADDVVRSDGPWREQVQEMTGGGVDVVLDPVGGDLAAPALRSLGPLGRYLVVGFASGAIPPLPANHILLRNRTVVGVEWATWITANPMHLARTLEVVLNRLARGVLHPPKPTLVSLDELPAVLRKPSRGDRLCVATPMVGR